MKGKNKLILVLFAVMALVATSVGFALKQTVDTIRYANAEAVDGFTAKLEGDVIFSAERVYFAVDENGNSDYGTRRNELTYNGYTFNSIVTNNGVEYFGDYGLTRNNYDYSYKKVIDNGDFAMVNDKAFYTAGSGNDSFTIKEGIMITLGGYYYAKDSNDRIIDKEIQTNAKVWDSNNNSWSVAGEGVEAGAKMSYVSAVQATLDGEPITIPNSRDYDNSSHEDFTWFIVPSEATEGHYKISFLYSVSGVAQPVQYEFEFYLLLQSSYDKKVEVNGNSYDTSPKMSNAGIVSKNSYNFFSGTSLNYPTLTFDYSRYDLSYTHTSGDKTIEVDFEYDESTKTLNLSNKVYNDIEQQPPYEIDVDKTIVTIMFVDQGEYDFHFDYIYNEGEKMTIPQEQIPFENIKLNIYGYQLKYSKAGFASADMTHLEIYKNGTMFILVNGFTNAKDEQIGDDLGVSYNLITPTEFNQPTGMVADFSNQIKNSNSESATLITANDGESIDALIKNEKIDDFIKGLYNKEKDINNYQRTDRGLWLTLKDEYSLDGSFYYYNATEPISTAYVTAGTTDENNVTTYTYRKDFTKVTTFTAPGYYLVQVQYKIKNNENPYIQYFAFQITATTPMLELYKTKLEVLAGNADYINSNSDSFYADEYTNQNVYADWKETEIFESSITGKLYYRDGKYATETELKAVADGKRLDSTITVKSYTENTLIKDSGAYLLVLEVENSATKTYTYFTIDKDSITGLEVYEVVIHSIDNRASYSIKKDANLQPVVHTSKSVIDCMFTLDWADKDSGAKISASYKFTPFIKSNQELENIPPIQQGNNLYKYVINEYTIGTKSKNIEISKPVNLNVELGVERVLTDQGIYEFYLVDQAGNELNYIVIVDRTEGVINATYGEDKTNYISGQLVVDYVELEWGTHKAINLGTVESKIDGEDNVIYKLINNNQTIDNYYVGEGSNLADLRQMFKYADGKNLFVVQNMSADIQVDKNENYYYQLTYQGTQQMQYANGATIVGWDDDGKSLFENATNWGVKINVDRRNNEDHNYVLTVKGSNQVTNTPITQFMVRITADEALGQVFSTSQEGGQYDTYVDAKGMGTGYFEQGTSNEYINHSKYYEGQASNDGLFVFEWAVPKDEDNFTVTEVKYNYYQLMDQETLSKITQKDIDDGKYPYYPYRYVEVANNEILKTEKVGDSWIETVGSYSKTNRITRDSYGNIIENREVNRSNAINLAYESYYNSNNELITRQVTQTGLYIITRTIVMNTDEGQEGTPMEYSYAFFVDRNMIVGYAINDVNSKIVGQFIHTAMPNSGAENGVKYDNFNKQGLSKQSGIYYVNNEPKTIEYKVYVETNKLPTLLQVPSGKYVSGNLDTREIEVTSYLNLKLRLSVYFKDTYKILPLNYKAGDGGAFIQLMDNVTMNKSGYIDLSFSNINDPETITLFKNARIQTDDNKLSLPGEYVFVIEDTVGHNLNNQLVVTDVNQFVFGIKLTNNAPETDVYSYANIDNNKSSNVYAEDRILYTNQEFIEFVIPVEDMEAYEAQLDISTLEVWRSDISGKPWLKLVPINGRNGFIADTSGYIQDISRIKEVKDKNGNVISYIIQLDTEVMVDEKNQITDYKEYTYTINVQYMLANTNYSYYEYKINDVKKSFYRTTYTVVIDRTPNSTNLDALMQEQGEYFEGYHTWLAEQNGVEVSEEINETFAYRDTTSISDYYGLANDLYYQFARQNGNLSNQAMYAFTVNKDSTFDFTGLSNIYYREIKLNDSVANQRMGLLPITNIYGEGYYHSFSENRTSYSTPSNISNFQDSKGNIYYSVVMGGSDYDANWGKFYEIVEKDMAGNLTQYVIYFASDEITNISMEIDGTLINEKNEKTLIFDNVQSENPPSFIGIDKVVQISGLAENSDNDYTTKKLYPYYGNINIYNASREKIKTIYTNTTSKHSLYDDKGNNTQIGFENEVYDVISKEGNYIIEYVDVFGNKYYETINNYTSGEHKLNFAALKLQEDYSTGTYYLKFSGLNTKVDNNTYWYVTKIEVEYNGKTITYTAGVPEGGVTKLLYSLDNNISENEVKRDEIEPDRLNLASNTQYMITLTDVGGNKHPEPISTTKNYYAYKLDIPSNMYAKDNIYYTANEVGISYNTEHYTWQISVEEDGVLKDYNYESVITDKDYLTATTNNGYGLIKLLPDVSTEPADHYGSLRIFKVWLNLKGTNNDTTKEPTYIIYIDTRTTDFTIKNTHEVGKIDYVKSTLKNGSDGNYQDYNMMDLISSGYYNQLIVETVNISWTRLQNDYFTYNYELYEFTNASDEPVELLQGSSANEHPIEPKENTTGKYIFKVTIKAKDGTWIATRIYGIYMSTTITGLYEVKDGLGNLYDYASITNLDEIYYDINTFFINKITLANALNFVMSNPAGGYTGDVDTMEQVFESFGRYTAIPMYIANTELTLHSNEDNGVSSFSYKVENSYFTIIFYRIHRANYQTFAVTMYVKPETNKNIINTLSFKTSAEGDAESLLNIGTAKTIYNANAEFYQLTFNSYNINTNTKPNANNLEKHNKIIIDIYYNNVFAKRIKGSAGDITPIEFKNSGTYKLVVKDTAGNVQYFGNQDFFTLVLMKKNDILYTINGEAPVQYAYYDSAVTLQINRYNEATGKNNYDINTIKIDVKRNSVNYTGYEHPTESSTYTFREYGTYLVTMTANLLDTRELVTAQLVFTILNPNETRTALDFTSIYGYNIISVYSITKTAEKDVTEKFMSLLKDKSNVGEIDVYNKLITYERVIDAIGTATQGKVKLRVVYEVKNDDLLPARIIEFSFTLNNEKATITSSIAPGGKTTKAVTLKFNAANIYDQIGDCKLVINGETVLEINENSSNSITEIQVTEVGNYYVQLMGDSGNIAHSFNFTINQPLNTVSIILIIVVVAIVVALVGTFIWLRTRMKVR